MRRIRNGLRKQVIAKEGPLELRRERELGQSGAGEECTRGESRWWGKGQVHSTDRAWLGLPPLRLLSEVSGEDLIDSPAFQVCPQALH